LLPRCGSSASHCRHELRSLPQGRSPMLLAHYFDPHSTTNHLTSPSSAPFPCSVRPPGSALWLTWLRALVAVSPTCPAESCSLALRTGCLALGCSRPRLTTHALTLCFMSFHGLTLQVFHLR